MGKWVYEFGDGSSEGRAEMRELLGGKGANLAEMCHLGLPVPPGFTITTEVCTYYYRNGNAYPDDLAAMVDTAVVGIESKVGDMKFGDRAAPLLVSVRSGAAVSMPGMMDTVLNLGLNDATVEGLARKSGNPRFAWDAYRRFMQMFGDVVKGVPHHDFEHALQSVKDKHARKLDTELTAEEVKEVCEEYRSIYRRAKGEDFPTDAWEQLAASIDAVFGSWNNPRAVKYRQLNDIRGLLGTAVNVQTMVFGNMGDESGTGVAFTATRPPARTTSTASTS